MLLLIDIFSINRSRGYENPSLDIIVIELCSTGGFPLEEAREHCFQLLVPAGRPRAGTIAMSSSLTFN
jgi:hypothetical protein